jgi:hypothetical protein
VKASALANDKQTSENKALSARVAPLTGVPFGQEAYERVIEVNAVDMRNATGMRSESNPLPRRKYGSTPQIRQRDNYTRKLNNQPNNDAPCSFRVVVVVVVVVVVSLY